jgi:hypothetical protein
MDHDRFCFPSSITAGDLYARLGNADTPVIADVGKPAAFDNGDVMLPAAIRLAPADIERWRGLSANHRDDDHAMLECGMVVYDALHAWCRDAQAERHAWTPSP